MKTSLKTFIATVSVKGAPEKRMSAFAGTTAKGLYNIHRDLQRKEKLKPSDYRITGFFWLHESNAVDRNSHVEQPVDIPTGRNPDLSKQIKFVEQESEMEFMAEVPIETPPERAWYE